MRKFLVLLVLYPFLGYGQSGLTEIVAAEKAFIDMARTQNRRDAFLAFLSDSAVTQGPKGPIKGKSRIAAQPVTEDLLSWDVSFSVIAGSNDFGFNTGPWYYRSKKTDEKPVGFGEFNSVWKRMEDGSWKNVLDIGVSHGPSPEVQPVWETTGDEFRCNCIRNPNASMVLDAETKFITELSKQVSVTYMDRLLPHTRMMVSGHHPFVGTDGLNAFIAATPEPHNYAVMGSETASSKDFGYVYGTADIRVTKDGKQEIRKATYVRVWKVECCKWKLILDLLSYQP